MTVMAKDHRNLAAIKGLTYLMFMMFAMTTDSVGLIIPEVIRTFELSLTAGGTFQYATMGGIAVAGLLLGWPLPEGVDEAAIRKRLLNDFNIEIGAGLMMIGGFHSRLAAIADYHGNTDYQTGYSQQRGEKQCL